MKKTTLWIAYLKSIYTLVHAGIDLLSAHRLIAQQQRFQSWQRALWDLCHALSQGRSYHQALQALQPSPLIALYLDVGERTGQLEAALFNLYTGLNQQLNFKQQCVHVLIYPCLVLSIALCLMAGLIFYILPTIAQLYTELHIATPVYMHVLLCTVTPMHCTLALLGLCSCIYALRTLWQAGGTSRIWLERILYKVPGLGRIWQDSALAQQAQLLGMSFRCGMPLTEALAFLTQEGIYHDMRSAWQAVHTGILQGVPFSATLRSTGRFEPIFIELIDIGERTGQLDEQLQQACIYYTEALSDSMQRFKALLQPCMMLILGILLGGWLILLYYPLIQVGYLVG